MFVLKWNYPRLLSPDDTLNKCVRVFLAGLLLKLVNYFLQVSRRLIFRANILKYCQAIETIPSPK